MINATSAHPTTQPVVPAKTGNTLAQIPPHLMTLICVYVANPALCNKVFHRTFRVIKDTVYRDLIQTYLDQKIPFPAYLKEQIALHTAYWHVSSTKTVSQLTMRCPKLTITGLIHHLSHRYKLADAPITESPLNLKLRCQLTRDRAQDIHLLKNSRIQEVPTKWLLDPVFLLAAVEISTVYLDQFDLSLRNNPELMEQAVSKNGDVLSCLNSDLKKNPSIVQAAIKSRPDAIAFASPETPNYENIVLNLIELYPKAICNLPRKLQRDPVFLEKARLKNRDIDLHL